MQVLKYNNVAWSSHFTLKGQQSQKMKIKIRIKIMLDSTFSKCDCHELNVFG